MKRYLSLFVFLTLSISALNALEGVISFEALEAKVKALENRLNEICSEKEDDSCVISLISACPCEKEWLVRLDILYWQSRVGGTGFAYSNWKPSVELPLQGRTRKIDFGWDWGVRAGIGRNFYHDEWDLNLTYTLFSN